MEKEKQELADKTVKAISNLKIVIEKSAMDFKSHAQLQDDINFLTEMLQEYFILKYNSKEKEADCA